MIKRFRGSLLIVVLVLLMSLIQQPNFAFSNELSPKTKIEKPGSEVKGTVEVKGWALSSSGIAKVEIIVDGKFIGQARIGMSRGDVAKVYPSYPEASSSGYSYWLNTNNLTPGTHTLKVRAIAKSGKSHEALKTIKVLNPVQKTKLEQPATGNTTKGIAEVRGWAVNTSGIKAVEVYADNKLMGKAQYGLTRNDVGRAYPSYPNSSQSGYSFKLDTTKLAQGKRVLKVKVTGNNGEINVQQIQINVVYPEAKLKLEWPKAGSETIGEILIRGWALNPFGVKEITLQLDGKLIGQAQYGTVRADVAKVYPNYPNSSASGFNFKLDSTQIKNGSHTLQVTMTGLDGSTLTTGQTFNIMNNTVYYSQYTKTLDEMVDVQYNLRNVPPFKKEDGLGEATPLTDNNIGNNWVPATKEDVKHYLDPNNFINDDFGKYMFLRLNFAYGISADDLNRLLQGKGVLEGKGEVFLKAARENDINPAYLVSHALLETGNGGLYPIGAKPGSNLALGYDVSTIDGNPVEPKRVYNMFGIGARNADPLGLGRSDIQLGAETAYIQKWFSVDEAILGGAKFISEKYINHPTHKQNTLYKMRWNPENPATHQYATDVAWAYKQTLNLKKLMDQFPDAVLIFDVPVY